MITFTDITDENNSIIGQIKYDGHRKMFQWTALGLDGSRLADTETYEKAEKLILNQEL
jgi:hypothetical protein